MSILSCPKCSSTMETISSPDISKHVCPSCGGVFMDRESVHLSSPRLIDKEEIEYILSHNKKYNEALRPCPMCGDHPQMVKMSFFYTNHILDCCPSCGGFFFDNEEYDEFDKYSIDEGVFKGYIKGHLIRIDTIFDRYIWVDKRDITIDKNIYYFKFSAYFKKPLNSGLVMLPETSLDNLLNFIGLLKKQDIRTGFPEFDKKFIIQGKNSQQIKEIFSNQELRTELLEFREHLPTIYSEKGTFKLLDKYIAYVEGPYCISPSTPLEYNANNDPSGIVSRMVKIASLIDAQH